MQKIFRTLIIIAMLITAYLMILAWQKDYGGQTATVATTTQSSQASDIAPTSGDVPVSASATASPVATEGKLISVKTDRYDIKINPVGGDIVHAALVDYASTLGSSEPFVILEQVT